MATNPIQLTSRTFLTILNDINSDSELKDKPEWFKRIWAGVGDVLSVYLNAQANQSFLVTAFTRQAVTDLCALIDYDLSGKETSNGTLLFDILRTAVFPFSVTAANLAALTQSTIAVAAKRFEARAQLNVVDITEVFAFTAVNTGTDIITVATDYTTGMIARFTSSGTLPAPLATATDYYIIRVSATEIKLATTRANAYAGTNIDLTTQGTGNHTLQLFSRAVTCYQQESISQYSAGISDGITEWQEFQLRDQGILIETVVVEINSVNWTRVETLVDSISTDKHYRVLFNTDGSARLLFGNGTFGAIPGNFDINVNYAYGGGSTSNISTADQINIYAGGDSNIVGVSNPSTFTGGDDVESLASAKKLAPLLLKARNRFITAEDGEALVLDYGGISLAKVIENAYGVLSAKVIGIANGSEANPSASVKSAIQQYLIDRTVLESIDVRFVDCTITSVNVTSAAKVRPGYQWNAGTSDDVDQYFDLAWKLVLSPAGEEIKDTYDESGIAATVTLINSIFSMSFDSNNYDQIRTLIVNLEARQFGDYITESEIFGYIQPSVDGVDYMTISSTTPALPITLSADEITKSGVLTLSEIP